MDRRSAPSAPPTSPIAGGPPVQVPEGDEQHEVAEVQLGAVGSNPQYEHDGAGVQRRGRARTRRWSAPAAPRHCSSSRMGSRARSSRIAATGPAAGSVGAHGGLCPRYSVPPECHPAARSSPTRGPDWDRRRRTGRPRTQDEPAFVAHRSVGGCVDRQRLGQPRRAPARHVPAAPVPRRSVASSDPATTSPARSTRLPRSPSPSQTMFSAPVHPVDEAQHGRPGRPVHRRVACRLASPGVRGGILARRAAP